MLGEFHTHEKLVRGSNPSFIVLNPKKEEALTLDDYRPISLIGCVYKVLSKVLVARLSKVIDQVISPNQSMFVSGRNILDGAVILNEAIMEAKKRRMNRFFFKIDFAKAYDTMDWGFLKLMMQFFNF